MKTRPSYWDNVYLADPTVFRSLHTPDRVRRSEDRFDTPTSIALSCTAASYYFGDQNSVGREPAVPHGHTVQVTLVV